MRKFLPLLAVFAWFSLTAQTQTKTVTGRITDQQNQPVPFASIRIKGTRGGTAADADGNFQLKVLPSAVLTITGAGIATKEVPVNGQGALTIQVVKTESELSTVVVTTAAGTKVNKIQQGFNSTVISSAALTEAKPTTLASALAGKAPGLQVMATGGGVNPTYRITLRGQRSFTGNNQPLLIVDGSIVVYDMLTNISPEDIDNVNILNGPAAVALYGSQASNGAMVITTKRPLPGTNSIHVSQTTTAERVAYEPKEQHAYGSGGSGYGTDSLGRPIFSPLENESYGPKFDGSTVNLGYALENGDQLTTPYSYYKDRNKFWQTGLSNQTDLSISSADDKSSTYISGQYLTTTGTMIQDKYTRASVRFNGSRKFSPKFRVNYSLSYLQNRYNVTSAETSVYDQFLNMPGEIPILKFKNWQTNEYANPNGYYNPWYPNPYFQIANNRNITNNDYLTGSAEMHWTPVSGLDLSSTTGLTVKTGTGKTYTNAFTYTDFAQQSSGGSKTNIAGGDAESQQYYNEIIENLKAAYIKHFGDLSASAIIGFADQQDYQNNIYSSIGGLAYPGLYNLGNTVNYPAATNSTFEARQVGFYYDVQLGWKEFLFLHTTGREDIVSVLSPNNRTFFYPSVDASLVMTKLIPSLDNAKWLDMWKLRGSVSKVGQVNLGPNANPYGAYSLLPTFGQGNGYPYNGAAGYQLAYGLISPDLKPEITKSWEVGTDFKLIDGRIDATVTYFDEHTSNQTLTTSVSWATGFNNLLTNAGESESKGIETSLKLLLVHNKDWNVNLGTTYTYDNNKVLSITQGLNNLSISKYTDGTGAYAIPHYQWPEIMGYDYQRHDGKVVINPTTGMPIVNNNLVTLGNANAKHVLGLSPSITFRSFTLEAVFEYHGGLKRYNSIGFDMDWSGMGARTAQYNRQRFVFPNSTYQDAGGKWVSNTNILISENGNGNGGFWTDATENYNVTSNYVTNGAFWKLREASLTYSLSPRIIKSVKVIKSASVSLVGRNLFLWLPKDNLYTDPDYSDAGNTSNGTGLTGYQPPPSRYMGANISVNF